MIGVDEARERARRVDRVSRELWHLLARDGDHRIRWARASKRSGQSRRNGCEGTLNYAAIARVVSEWVAFNEEVVGEADDISDARDLVRRALLGTTLEPRTLRWFCEAFEFAAADASRLFSLLNNVPTSWPARWAHLPGGGHRTRSLNEHHVIGPARRPIRHRTVQVIESEVDGLDLYRFRFDTPDAVVMFDHGVATPVQEMDGGLWYSDLLLDRPLRRGETASLAYTSLFTYRTQPPPEFRRGARGRIDNVSLTVEFDPAAIPDRVWWGTWDAEEQLQSHETVELLNGCAHRYLDYLEGSIAGFTWEWHD